MFIATYITYMCTGYMITLTIYLVSIRDIYITSCTNYKTTMLSYNYTVNNTIYYKEKSFMVFTDFQSAMKVFPTNSIHVKAV